MIITLILLAALLLFAAYGYWSAYRILNMPLKSTDMIMEREMQNPAFDYKWFESLEKEKVTVISPFGYKLAGFFIPAKHNTVKTMIFCHGITVSLICSVKFAKMFYERGWNLFLYDQRRHGLSEGKMTTYGFYEKHDLKAVVDYIKIRISPKAVIGIHGESMGASIALQYAGMEDGASFYIADCPYSNLWDLLSLRLAKDYHLPGFPFLHITSLFIRILSKFRVTDVNPLKDVEKINNPVLFIHGEADYYVPTYMSRQLYERKKGSRDLYIAPEAGHVRSLYVNPKEYEKRVFEFIESQCSQVMSENIVQQKETLAE